MIGNELTCAFCEKQFLQKTKKKSDYCSSLCRSKAHYHLSRHGVITTEKEINTKIIEICPICNGEYIKRRADKMTCSKSCSSKLSHRKNGHTKSTRGGSKKKELANKEFNLELKGYLTYLKRKCFYLDETDIFKAINFWDTLYPSRYIPESGDRAMFFETMVLELILYYKKTTK